MSYAIIRNTKYKRNNLKGIYRHNERKNQNYSNENIDKEKSYLNYSIKAPQFSYEKEFERIRKLYDLKGQIKTVSNIACEYIITSDKDFFEKIGEIETKRYFETAFKFVSEYKDLGEQYIMSAKVHMDEETPHMHLIFLPVVHTTDKKGNSIDKLACSEFWKAKDSYRQLQDAFYNYMVSHNFDLERGIPKEESEREHIDLKEYKDITNFNKTKEKMKNIKLELPDVPEIANISKFTIKRDEKILEEIIKPKDELINELYHNNVDLHKELSKQANVVEEAKKYQQERNQILLDNQNMHIQMRQLEREYKSKKRNLDYEYDDLKKKLENEYYNKLDRMDYAYRSEIHELKKENKLLRKTIDKFKVTVSRFISWVCKRFELPSEDEIVREFERENHTCLDVEKQLVIEKQREEKSWQLEL